MTNASNVTILSVGPMDDDQIALQDRLKRSAWSTATDPSGRFGFCSTLETALSILRKNRVSIVLCDAAVDWRQILESFRGVPAPPFLIVTSRLADDRLWSEALNLGAYDVLAKPFNAGEVLRVLTMAWIRSMERSALPVPHKQTQEAVLYA